MGTGLVGPDITASRPGTVPYLLLLVLITSGFLRNRVPSHLMYLQRNDMTSTPASRLQVSI
jgi:hypothetical protein